MKPIPGRRATYTPWRINQAWSGGWAELARSLEKGLLQGNPLATLARRIGESPLSGLLFGAHGMDGLWMANRPEWTDSEDVLNARWVPAEGAIRFTYLEQPHVRDPWTRAVPAPDAFAQLERIVHRLHWVVEYRAAGRGGDETAGGDETRFPLQLRQPSVGDAAG